MDDAVFNSDGSEVVTASADTTARIWETATGRPIVILNGHTGVISRAAFGLNDRLVVTASGDGTARIWDAKTGKLIRVLEPGGDFVLDAEFSPDGTRIVTTSYWKQFKFSPDGKLIKQAEAGTRKVSVWEVDTGKEIMSLPVSVFTDQAMYSPDGRLLATFGSFENTGYLWESETGYPAGVLDQEGLGTDEIGFSSDGKRLIAASVNGDVRIFDLPTRTIIARYKGTAAAISPDATHLVTATGSTATLSEFLTTQALIADSKKLIPRCLTISQRVKYFLEPQPPDWCIELDKWPFQSQEWKNWLRYSQSGIRRPLPSELDAAVTIGNQLREQKDFVACGAAYSRAIEMLGIPLKEDWPIFFDRGICYEHSNQWPRAEADMKKALELDPDQPLVLNYLGYSWVDMGMHLEEGTNMIRRAAEQRPDDGYIVEFTGLGLLP